MYNATRIGSFLVTTGFEYSPLQEFAGAVETVQIPAGEYEVVRYGSGISCGIRLLGTRTYSGWFGTSTRVDTTPVEGTTATAYKYDYELADGASVRVGNRSGVVRLAA